MNRTIRQTGAYALTCLFMIFMFSALMPILCLPLQAADSNDNKVLSLMANTAENSYDLLKESIQAPVTIDTMEINISFPKGDISDYGSSNVKTGFSFSGNHFRPVTGTELDPKISQVEVRDVVSMTITLEKVFFTGSTSTCEFEVTFTPDGDDSKKETYSFEAKLAQDSTNPPSGDDRYSLQSTRFISTSDRIVSKVTRGSYKEFRVTIKEFLYTAEEFKKLVEAGEDSQHPKIKIAINSDFISNNSVDTTIKDIFPIENNTGVSYTIVFHSPYYTGDTTQMILDVTYPDGVIRTFDEAVSGCELYDDSDDDDDDDNSSSSSRPDIAPPTPNIIISEFSYGGAPVTAASNFDLRLVFTNTSQKLPIDNIIMKVTVPEAFTLTSSSNTFYVESMSKNASVEKVIGLSVKPNAEPISHAVKLSFSFEAVIDRERKQFTSEEEISIPVSQLDRFSVNPVEVPPELAVGEDTNIEITFVNKGKTPVYNVTAEITGNISQAGQRQFIGNVESGHEDSADFLLAPLEEGPVSGEIIISYEDANMNITELRNPFSATAVNYNMPPPDMDMGVMNPEDMEPMDLPWYQELWQRFPPWVWGVGGLVVVILLGYIGKVIRVHRERKLLEDDDDEDL